MEKRLVVLFCAVIVLFNVVFYRTYSLSTGTGYSQVAKNQSTYTLEVAQTRGMIYDCAMRPLVNATTERVAAVLPGTQSAQTMRRLIEDRDELLARLEDRRPFVIRANADTQSGEGIDVFEIPKRYADPQPAAHLIGHLRDGVGVYGLEQAYDAFLTEHTGTLEAQYQVDATGRAPEGFQPLIRDRTDASRQGLVLTLDERIQRIAEYAAKQYVTKGAVVVMDCASGDLKASVSLPEFDPNDLTSSLEGANNPFVNKALSPFNVGSSFKLVVTACALEHGVEADPVECVGRVDVGGQIFHCNNRAGHGWMDLQQAVEQSCNPFFIELARKLGAERLRETARRFGFGTPSELAPGLQSAAGNLPAISELQNPADVANFGFGQGVLTATPIQLAQMVSVFANGGLLVRPRLVEGYSDATGETLEQQLPTYAANRVIEEQTAARLRDLMIGVVEQGSGKRAKPAFGGAGGKTASAQTGQYYDAARTNEVVEAWFVGFYPAEKPKYTIVVLAQGADSGSTFAAPIFKVIADALGELEGWNASLDDTDTSEATAQEPADIPIEKQAEDAAQDTTVAEPLAREARELPPRETSSSTAEDSADGTAGDATGPPTETESSAQNALPPAEDPADGTAGEATGPPTETESSTQNAPSPAVRG